MIKVHRHLDNYFKKMKQYEEKYLGFPNNMTYDYKYVSQASSIYINNAGDPFSTLAWNKHSKLYEQEVVRFFLDLYKLDTKNGWGYITTGGTEGNMEGLLLARETLPEATLYFSEDAHYSINKIAHILRIKHKLVPSQKNGEMDYEKLNDLLAKNKEKEAIILVNCGTTIKGAFDNLIKIKSLLKKNGIKKKYIHVDAALSGMVTPFIKNAPFYSFDKGIDSIAISMHKFLGVPLISGIILTNRVHVEKLKNKIEYINSHDTTILGSRNGQSPLYTWYAIKKYGKKTFKKHAYKCIENAQYLHGCLKKLGYNAYLNDYSNTVYFDKPPDEIVNEWQLSTYEKIAHIVVMQHVDRGKIDNFVRHIKKLRQS